MQQSVVNIEFSAVPANELNSAIPHQRVALSNLTEPGISTARLQA
jgi:hypothetical protein